MAYQAIPQKNLKLTVNDDCTLHSIKSDENPPGASRSGRRAILFNVGLVHSQHHPFPSSVISHQETLW